MFSVAILPSALLAGRIAFRVPDGAGPVPGRLQWLRNELNSEQIELIDQAKINLRLVQPI